MKKNKILNKKRQKIDKITKELVKLIAKREKITYDTYIFKKKFNLPITDRNRKIQIIENSKKLAKEFKVSSELIEDIVKSIIKNSKKETQLK